MSTRCRAAILIEPNEPLIVDEVEFPDPGPDQVLVKLFASGVCHSQIHTMRRPARPGQRLPALLGHESTGVVAARGHDVKHVKEGDHVITTWVDRNNSNTPLPLVNHTLNDRPQSIASWRGKEVSHSAATWAEYALASDRVVVPMPDDAYDSRSLRASATSSCRFFAGTAGFTVMMFGVLGPRITGAKSVNGS